MKTKIFCDSADYKLIKFFNNKNLVDGFTTNPSLMRIAGAKNYKDYSLKILKVCKKKPISFEVFADNSKEMLIQAYKINSWGKNVYVKIPVVNSKGLFMGSVIKELSDKGIKLNITSVYTYEQAKKIYKSLNKKTKSIISIFAGRMADKGKDPLPIFKLTSMLMESHFIYSFKSFLLFKYSLISLMPIALLTLLSFLTFSLINFLTSLIAPSLIIFSDLLLILSIRSCRG